MRLSSKNRKPRSRKAFACLCLAGGLLFLGMVFGLSRYSDMQSCEHRMNELIDFVKEQSSAYVQYNETAVAKALVRGTTAMQELDGLTLDCGEDALRQYLCELDNIKPVVYCGDLNVAHEEIDLKNPKTNHFNPGFSDEERGKMTQLLSSGFLDSFRTLYPDKTDAYSWWSYRAQSRARNVGWRIDYFIVSERLRSRIENADILAEVMGSDHCPVLLELKEEEK